MKYRTFPIKVIAIERDLPDSDVPCNTINCIDCCVKLSPYLTPDEFMSGLYIYTFLNTADPDKPAACIPRTERGCIYLDDDKKCSIYNIRPRACKQFDCRLNHSPIIQNKFLEETND